MPFMCYSQNVEEMFINCERCEKIETYINNKIYKLSNLIYEMEVTDQTYAYYQFAQDRLTIYVEMRKEFFGD